jgi:hypothetical protein
MKVPYCVIDGIKYQLHVVNNTLRFPNDLRGMPDLNKMWLDCQEGNTDLKELFDYYINSGTSYEMVYQYFSVGAQRNVAIKRGEQHPMRFKLYTGKSLRK